VHEKTGSIYESLDSEQLCIVQKDSWY